MTLQIDQQPVLAVDVGGTMIRLGLVSTDGQITAREHCPTIAEEGPGRVTDRILSSIERLIQSCNVNLSQLHSISIAAAGSTDTDNGIVTMSPSLPGWVDIPLRDTVRTAYGISTFLLNDASAAALGENRFGAGRGSANLVYITVSTGIGGGIIVNNQLYSGTSGSAGDIGHMTIDIDGPLCNCGNYGCLETLASGTAVAREAIRRIENGERSSLANTSDGIENITAERVGRAAREGDTLALEVISRAAYYLGVGLASLVNILNPEIIIVGGGMSKLGDLLLEPTREVLKEKAFRLPAQAVRIVPSLLGDDAGVLGAAIFAYQTKPAYNKQA